MKTTSMMNLGLGRSNVLAAACVLAMAACVSAAEVKVTASRCCPSDTTAALFDGKVPLNSSDHGVPRFTFWSQNVAERSGAQWVECVFAKPRTVRRVDVYWFDDFARHIGHCALPASWCVKTRAAEGAPWVEAPKGTTYTRKLDAFSTALLPAVQTVQAIRIELVCEKELSAGILEVRTSDKVPAKRPDPKARRAATDSLAPLALEPLPLGAIRPAGWLKYQLDLMTEGLVGRLYEKSNFLKPDNGWLKKESTNGWEEQPYWFRSFVKLAVLTQNERCLKVTREWIDKILATRDADGWYGPQYLKEHKFGNGVVVSDIWGHMVMCEALWSWWEYSHDERVFKLLSDFMIYLARTNPNNLIAPTRHPGKGWNWKWTIQHERAGDLLPAIFSVYSVTHDSALLDLADRLRNKLLPPGRLWAHQHNVTFSQRFAYETVYSRLSRDPADRGFADYWYDLHMAEWGQMPRGQFASDENCRVGATDPRYGTETCTWGEFTRSFQLLADITGETKWADRNEDIVFNHAPAAYTPDWKALHYITASNQTQLDARTDHNYCNAPPMIAYSSEAYRCCRHNAAMTFPIFTENLVKKSADGALVFWMYAPHTGATQLGKNKITWSLATRYPFRETAKLVVTADQPAQLKFRVPGWAKAFTAGKTAAAAGERLVTVAVPAGRTELDIAMQATCEYHVWTRTGGVTVDRGPLSYSLAIGEKYGQFRRKGGPGGSSIWVETPTHTSGTFTEVLPTTDWNYALDTSKTLTFREREWSDNCFVSTNAPCEIVATGRRLPEWTLQDGQPAALQRSPAYTAEPLETLRFVPLGCQRLRLSVLPRGTDDPVAGHVWRETAPSTPRAHRPRITPN